MQYVVKLLDEDGNERSHGYMSDYLPKMRVFVYDDVSGKVTEKLNSVQCKGYVNLDRGVSLGVVFSRQAIRFEGFISKVCLETGTIGPHDYISMGAGKYSFPDRRKVAVVILDSYWKLQGNHIINGAPSEILTLYGFFVYLCRRTGVNLMLYERVIVKNPSPGKSPGISISLVHTEESNRFFTKMYMFEGTA